MVRISSCFFVVVLILLSIREASSQLGAGPHITDVNILLPPRMKNPVEYRLQGSDGCFKWSWDHHDILSVTPEFNSSSHCSTSARVKSISPYSGRKETAVYATDIQTGMVIRCKVFIDIFSRIQIFHNSIKLDLDGLSMLRVRAFDNEDNEFSSLVGLQFMWKLMPESGGGTTHHLAHVPLKESPLTDCGGLCGYLDIQKKLEDSGVFADLFVVKGTKIGHEKVSVHLLEAPLTHIADEIVLTVAEAMSLEPRSPVYVLMGASFGYTLKVMRGNVPQAVHLPSSHHRWSALNSSVVQVDSLNGLTKALSLGVTTVVVEDTRVAGHIQGSSINVVTPDAFILYISPWSTSGDPTTESKSFPSSMHWYVVSGRQYLIQMKIFSGRPDAHEIYITETDDIKLYGEETDYWKIVSVPDDLSSEYGWRNSRILKAFSPGLEELTAALTYFNGHQNSKEVLKVVQDIVVCEKVQFTLNSEDDAPKILLPWTPAVYQEMELIVTGGCAKALSDYKWFTSDMSILSVSAYGIIQAKRPGIATVKVVSTFDSQNFDEVIVEVSIPSSMVMLQYFPVETVVGSHLQAAVTMKALNGASFSRCDAFNSLIKWKTESDSFVIVNATAEMMMLEELRSTESSPPCSRAYIYTSSPGRTVLQATLAKEFHYFDKSLSESIDLKATLSIGAYLPLTIRQDSDGNHHGGYWFDKTQEETDIGVSNLYLVPGTYVDVMLLGGPERWDDNVEFTETVTKVNEDEEDLTNGDNIHHNFDHHANMFRVSCQTLGSYKLIFQRGNLVGVDHPLPAVAEAFLSVQCSLPSSVVLIVDEPVNKLSVIRAASQAERAPGRLRVTPVTVANGQIIRVAAVGISDSGEAFSNSSTLSLRWELSSCDNLASWDDDYNSKMTKTSWERFLALRNESGLCTVRLKLRSIPDLIKDSGVVQFQMANYLAQFQTVKTSCDRIVAAVEDVSDLWPTVKGLFEEHQPLKRAFLTNRTRNPVLVENLPVEFILTTDARLRSRSPQEQYLFWFREPYATIVLVTCEDLDEFKNILKPRLKLIVQNDEREWFIVFVSKVHPSNDQATKSVKKVYAKLEVDFSSKKRERCCKLDIHGPNAHFWEDLELKITECIRNTLDRRVLFYEDEIRKLTEQRFMPIWNFCNFFILKESLAFIFEMAHLHEDALREYDELELCYLETVNMLGKQREFGGFDSEDDQATLLKPGSKPLTQIVQDDSFREFDFRQYLFACQSRLLFKLNRPSEVSSRGYSFVISFAKALTLHESVLPFCLREVWVITACLALLDATASHHHDGIVAPNIEKELYRLQGDLYSLARVKFMRLGYLIGYGTDIEKSPLNSACLSMLPWPKPAVWPSLPPDASSEVLEKEKTILQATSRTKHFGIQRKPLPLEPSVLLRVANRRRASLSTGNIPEIFDGRTGFTEGSGLEASPRTPSSRKVQAPPMSRTNSSPGNFESPLDRPMRLAEIFVAAEHALRLTISDHDLLKALSSTQDFEHKYLNLTKGAAENYHRSWWKRHGVVLDGEIAAVCFKHGKYDLAANSYEKVCALYAGERWQDLLAEVLPNLAECQKNLNDHAGYMSSCVRLLSLDKGLFSPKERQAFQIEVVNLAHSEMENPVPLDVSSLITFSGSTGPPLQLCDGDPGTLLVTVWSGFPDDITLDSLSLTLVATNNTDEGGQALKSSAATVLKPGRNTITFDLPPQKPGSYVLGVVTGQIGRLRFRSHSFSKGGPADTDDFMSYEKPTRPILKVSKPRALVDLASAVSSALLINEAQWIGIIVHPINYSLKGAILHIDTGPGLKIEDSYGIEMERYVEIDCDAGASKAEVSVEDSPVSPKQDSEVLNLCDGKIVFSEWASNVSSILWVPVRALSEKLARGSSSVTPLKQDILEGMRTVALKLEFGMHHNQIFERTVAAHFTDPFDVTTRVVNKCNDGTMVLQVMLHSLVKVNLIVLDAWLDLQEGFVHGKSEGRPTSTFFPLVVSPGSRAAVVFSISLEKTMSSGKDLQLPESILNIKYEINGDRAAGAHKPVDADHSGSDSERRALVFKSAIVLQRPVLDPCLTVGFLQLPSDGLRVGKLITIQWRVERLKELKGSEAVEQQHDEVLYEVNANSENWMIAGRKRGHVSLSEEKGSRVVISILCVPLVAGYVRPPQLSLPNVEEENVRSNPPGPHLVCVLPPLLSSSYCVPVK